MYKYLADTSRRRVKERSGRFGGWIMVLVQLLHRLKERLDDVQAGSGTQTDKIRDVPRETGCINQERKTKIAGEREKVLI